VIKFSLRALKILLSHSSFVLLESEFGNSKLTCNLALTSNKEVILANVNFPLTGVIVIKLK